MIDPAQIRAAMKVPPQLQEAYQKIVAAGMKVMFSEQTGGMMMQQLKSSPDIVKNISTGMAGLMAILFRQSKEMPQELILPAALELLTHAVDFITRTKMADVTPQEVGEATQETVYAVMEKFNVPRAEADQMLQQMADKSKGAQSQQGGIINGAVQ